MKLKLLVPLFEKINKDNITIIVTKDLIKKLQLTKLFNCINALIRQHRTRKSKTGDQLQVK